MAVKSRLTNYISLVPSALILITALLGNRSGAQRLGSYYIGAALSFAVIIFSELRLLRRRTRSRADFLWLVMPGLFLLGIFGTVAATQAGIGIFFAILASYLFYFYHRHFPSPIPLYIEQVFTLYGAFLLSIFLWSFNYFFTPAWWITTLLMFGGFFLLFLQAFYKMARPPGEAVFDALVMALLMVEVSWAVLFWPVHFFTAAVISFAVFYLAYMLGVQYFKGRLNRRKIYFQTSLISIVVLITLISSSWQPIK